MTTNGNDQSTPNQDREMAQHIRAAALTLDALMRKAHEKKITVRIGFPDYRKPGSKMTIEVFRNLADKDSIPQQGE